MALGRLANKTAIILGAAGKGNMGQAIARRFVGEGAKILVAGRDEISLAHFASEIGGHYVLCDITNKSQIEALASRAKEIFGTVDIAVNATGWGLVKRFEKTTEQDLDKITALQFKGPFFFMQAMVRVMKECDVAARGGGSIIQISSATATIMLDHHAAYMGTKAGIDHVVRCVAYENGRFGIRANSISPGFTNTPMTADAAGIAGLEEAFVREYPLGRIGTSEDIAAAAVYLASDECFVSGQNLQVNGGLTLRRNPTQAEINASIAVAQSPNIETKD